MTGALLLTQTGTTALLGAVAITVGSGGWYFAYVRPRVVGDPIDWVVRHAVCDVLLVDNLGYDSPQQVVLSGHGSPYSPVAVDVASAIAAGNSGHLSLWYPADVDGSDPHAMDDYRSELASILSVPVSTESIRTDGGRLPPPDLVVRRGSDDRLRDVAFDDRPVVPSPRCTAVTAYPHESRQRGLLHRLLERLRF